MQARAMAKFGYLYLKGGYWKGQQIIPKVWVEESTTGHIKKNGKPPLSEDLQVKDRPSIFLCPNIRWSTIHNQVKPVVFES
jgi:CubicO group peptidase (beta-lactamase class C family)